MTHFLKKQCWYNFEIPRIQTSLKLLTAVFQPTGVKVPLKTMSDIRQFYTGKMGCSALRYDTTVYRWLPTFRVHLLLPYSGWISECPKLIKDKGCLELALGHVKQFEICLRLPCGSSQLAAQHHFYIYAFIQGQNSTHI